MLKATQLWERKQQLCTESVGVPTTGTSPLTFEIRSLSARGGILKKQTNTQKAGLAVLASQQEGQCGSCATMRCGPVRGCLESVRLLSEDLVCMKDPWTKARGAGMEGGRWEGKVVPGKWRQLYMNNN